MPSPLHSFWCWVRTPLNIPPAFPAVKRSAPGEVHSYKSQHVCLSTVLIINYLIPIDFCLHFSNVVCLHCPLNIPTTFPLHRNQHIYSFCFCVLFFYHQEPWVSIGFVYGLSIYYIICRPAPPTVKQTARTALWCKFVLVLHQRNNEKVLA